MIGNPSTPSSDDGIVGYNRSTITDSAQGFTGVERECADVANRPKSHPVVRCPMSMGAILNDK